MFVLRYGVHVSFPPKTEPEFSLVSKWNGDFEWLANVSKTKMF